MGERIAELLQRIAHKDQRIYELEQEVKVKDEIIRKQVIMMSGGSGGLVPAGNERLKKCPHKLDDKS